MNAEDSLKLARRFIGLPLEKRRLFLKALEKEGVDFSLFPIPSGVEGTDRQALSYAQQRMWFLWQLDPQSGAYNLPSAVRLQGALDEAALEQAFASLIARHETLRTVFRQDEDGHVYRLPAEQPLIVERQDLCSLTAEQRETQVREAAQAQARRPFDLATGPLLRVGLLKLGETEHVLLLTLHHMVSDGWSMGVLIEEFSAFYDGHCQGELATLQPLPIQYGDYALWQRSWLEAGEQQRQLDYWQAQLGEEHPVLALPTDYPRPAVSNHEGVRHEFELEAGRVESLRAFARSQGASLFMVLLAGFTLLLHRYSGQDDVRIGVPIANRNRREVEGLIGFFVNTQVMRTQLDPQLTGSQLLAAVREATLGAQAHQDLPFERLVEALQVERNLGRNPLFQVLYNHQSGVAEVSNLRTRSGLSMASLQWRTRHAQFDLTLDTFEREGRLFAAFTYASELFSAATIERMAGHWLNLLAGLVDDPRQRLGELQMLDAGERQQVISQGSQGAVSYPHQDSIHGLIEAWGEQSPLTTALVFGEQSLTYQQLNERAERLAAVLQAQGVGPDVLVGIAVERSLEMVVGLLAVLKAGGAYVPFDPEYPPERLAYMAQDSGIAWLLTQAHLLQRLPSMASVQTLVLDEYLDESRAPSPLLQPVVLSPDNLAYVIYTSGSTGAAKGVTISHGALVNYVQAVLERLPLEGARSMAVVSTIAADLGHTTLFGALCSGRTLHVVPLDTSLDAARFGQYMDRHEIDVLKIVPSHIEALLADEWAGQVLPKRCLVLGGEACSSELLRRIAQAAPQCRVVNHYGPTETTVGALAHVIDSPARFGVSVPLGRPLGNVSAYILDASLQPVAVGNYGELHLAGAGVARGYHQRPGLTAERFVPNPFGPAGSRMYRTADLSRYQDSGAIEFAGRIDHQVKIRGYRIELGEITASLLAHASVREATVQVHSAGADKQLVAYVALAAGEEPAQSLNALREHLARSLPDYMVPAHFLVLPSLPLTLNGKLDVRALPPLEATDSGRQYRAPISSVEQQLAQIWAEVLQVEQVGLDDNFFALGGHSLLATQVISRIRRLLSVEIALRSLFETRNLEELAAHVQSQNRGNLGLGVVSLPRDQPLLASYAQQRQWLFWKLNPETAAYNTPIAVRLLGALDLAALQGTFDALVARHETLRTTFIESGDALLQVVNPPHRVPLALESIASAALSGAIHAETQALFDLTHGPLLRVKLLQLAEQEHVLVLTLHHIVSDGWSMGVLAHEFVSLYRSFNVGQAPTLSALPVQYADYAQWQRETLAQGEMQRQIDYWVAQLGHEHPVLSLPTDLPRPAHAAHREGRIDFSLPPALEQSVRALLKQQNMTLFQFFLGSFSLWLARYSGQDDIRVGIPVSNRSGEELEGLIGFFVNTLVFRAQVDGHLPVRQALQQMRDTALAAQAHQDLPFDKLVEVLNPQRTLNQSPLFQVMYNHLSTRGTAVTSDSLPGLQAREIPLEGGAAQFDLTLETLETNQGLNVSLMYSAELFETATAERMARHWLNLVEGIVKDPGQPVAQLPLLDAAERHGVLVARNPAYAADAGDTCVHRLFEAQARLTPQAPALVLGREQLTYAELEQRANRLAQRLQNAGAGPERLVGVALGRGFEWVIGVLAILKSGAAYVPLDPEYPAERLAYMIEDSGLQLLLSERGQSVVELCGPTVDVLLVDDLEVSDSSVPEFVSPALPSGLAYVIYTSGSTGAPKGVAVSHGALAMHCQAAADLYGIQASDCSLQFASSSFDAAAEQLFLPLIRGARLVLGDVPKWSVEQLLDQLEQHAVSVIDLPPAYLVQVDQALQALGRSISVRVCILGGEAWDRSLLRHLKQVRPAQLFNAYGPTEAVVSPLIWPCPTADDGSGYAPIGRPVGQRQGYVLDSFLEALPEGVAGELLVGGQGLARGYLHQPALTAQRFVPDPFGEAGGRLYRTGDLCRYGRDGSVEYLARIDQQVKIRGFRIELGEVETCLRDLPEVVEAVVLAQPGAAGLQLVAYVVARDVPEREAQAALREALKQQLKQRLPAYMVPAHLLFLEQLPLNINGKLDRKALPEPDISELQLAYVAPRSDLEQRIAQVWQQVLRLEQVGVTDNFFELGGDSIISIQVVSRARQAGIHFTPKDLFQYQTVQGLASVASEGEQGGQIDQGPVSGSMPLLPVQQAFFAENSVARHHWNQSVALKALVPVEAELLEKALSALVQQHDALRLSFQPEGDSWRGVFLAPAASPGASLLWQVEVADPAEFEALGEKAQRSLDLEHGPLMRAVLAQMADGSQHVLLVIHHLVVDGVSWRVLLEDLQTAYRQLQQGQALVLPAKTSAFKHWAEQLEGYAHSSQMAQEQDFWMAQLQDVSDSLPCDRAQDRDLHCHARTVQSQLSSSLTRQLLQQAPAAYRTQVNDLLLTALARVIARWSGNDSVLIQLEGHGREELFDNVDLTRTLGWFTSLFPVKLTANASPEASIKAVKEQLRAIPNKGLGFGVLRYLGEAPVQQALKALPAPRITFNYLGQFDGSFDNTPSGLFVPSGLGAGANQDPQAPLGNWLTLNGQVYDDVFTLGWTFSLERFDVATVQHLADDYSAELQALIEHCCREENASLTPSDFPLASLDQAQLDQLPLAARDVADLYPLSPMQQGMLFHSLYQQATGDYINQMRLEVSGLDVERFRDAWQATLDAHDILRTGFIWQGSLEQPVQVVFKQVELPFQVMDWRHRSDLAQALEQQDRIERETAFDLARAPLLRLVLIQTGDDSHHLIYTNHHILMDGWSNSQLLGEVLQRYSGHGPAAQLSRYRDYIAWLQGQDQQADQAFWQGQLATFEAPTRLSLALAHLPSASEHEGRSVLHQGFDAQRTRHFAEFAREQKITVNTLVQAAWLLLLQRYTGQATVAFGATVAGRPADLKGIEQQIGLFINTLPIVATPDPVLSVSAWLQQVQSQNLALREHEHTPLFEIQRWAGQGGEALFDNILVFENYPMSEALERGAPEALRFSSVVNHEQTHYPLTLAVALGETLELHYGYGHEYFSAAAVEQISGHFAQLLESLTHAAPHTALGELAMLGTSERLALLGSPVAVAAVAEEPVHRLIERRVAEAPEAVALLFAGEHLTYGQLNASANYLAERLMEQGVGPDVRVGVAFPRSLEVIVALLAVLKAGGTYVPLDPDYPEERLSYMMADSGMALLLTQQAVLPRLQLPQGLPTLMLDSLAEGSSRNPAPVLDADNLAYVIYTSGSTGQPKGVAVSHGPLAMHCRATALSYEMTAADCELHFLSFAFDGAHERWLTTLSQGGRLLIRDNQLWTARQTYDAIRQHGVTMAGFPPLYLHQLAELAQQDGNPPPVRLYSFGGDAMPRASFELVRQALRPQIMINGYGPTESVVTPLLWKTGPLDTCPTPYAPIGRCEGDRLAYVLGSDLNLLPEGMPGELYLGGTGLARGYLDRPGLSAERFVADPFSNRGARLYRTGDLVRRLADGSLEYLGRLDSQVKIRGFRIEIGEVESRLQQLPEVSEAAVIAHEGPTGQQLSAYVVAADAGLLQAPIEEQLELRNRLKRQLAQTLPEYMVPSGFTLLASLPFTPNGKLDRKALPLPDLAHSGRAYAAPQSELQQRIAAIWQDVLKVERVGLDDHFFELGGHSLLATQVTARMQLEFGANLPLDLLFKADSLTDYVELASPYLNLGSASDLSDLSDFLSELETI